MQRWLTHYRRTLRWHRLVCRGEEGKTIGQVDCAEKKQKERNHGKRFYHRAYISFLLYLEVLFYYYQLFARYAFHSI